MNVTRLALLVAAALAVVTRANAEEPPREPEAPSAASNDVRAEQLFRLAEKKFDTGRIAEACNDFELSLRLASKLGTLLNLALCHETVGRLATAWSEYNHAAAWATQNGQRDRHDFALQHALALETRLPRIVFQFPMDRAFASVEIDGEPVPVPRVYLPQYLDPGEHTIAITAPGKKRSSTSFRVIASGTEQIVVVSSLADTDAKTAPPAAPRLFVDDHPIRRGFGFASLGIGAAAAIFGGVYGGFAIHDKDSGAGRVATITMAAGLLAAATGTVLVVTSKTTRIAFSPVGAFGVF